MNEELDLKEPTPPIGRVHSFEITGARLDELDEWMAALTKVFGSPGFIKFIFEMEEGGNISKERYAISSHRPLDRHFLGEEP